VAFVDSTGRSYSTLAHTLPSARGNGEPLSGRFSPPAGASFVGLAVADNEARYVLASSWGYGFVTRFENFTGRNKAGKALINADAAADILPPVPVNDPKTDFIVSITSAGHLLAFPIAELPELDKGKGNKLVQIPPAKLKSGEEKVIAVASVKQGGELTIYSGRQKLVLSWRDLQAYEGSRAARGNVLPRGFTKVDRVESA
jgi:topoisomerase-4 subunit A